MSTQSLVVINPDELFKDNGIDKIKAIQIQIQNEIEKKREELRTMVGERYRDLLKAADTITEMQHTAKSVITHIDKTEIHCHALQRKRLSIQQPDKASPRYVDDLGDVSKIIEIKILLSLPEQIWIAIDNENYLLGAELFLFATHIHLSIGVSSDGKVIEEEYPVVSKQWEVITSYRNIITNGAQHQLKLIDISSEKAAECLTCIIFLDVVSYGKLLDLYLSLRISKLKEILNSDEVIRNKLKLVILLLQHTIFTVFYCFLGEDCLIEKEIIKIVGENSKPTLAKLAQNTSLADHYLSHLVRDFRPSINKELKYLTKDVVQSKTQTWIQNVENLLKTELTSIFKLINDIKKLHKIVKEDIHSLKYSSDWKPVVSTLLSTDNLNIYEHYMKSLVTVRIKQIIENVWDDSIANIMSSLKDIDSEVSKERGKQMENDIRWFVWKESIMDNQESLRLKTQGYTLRVMRLTNFVEKSIKQLLDDVELFVGENSSDLKMDVRSDSVEILSFLNKCSLDMLKRLSGKVYESCSQKNTSVTESGLIVRARFLQSLITHSPSLEKCLKQSQGQVLKEHPDDMLNSWATACSFLNEESTQIWELWKELTVVKLRNLIKLKLSPKISLRALLASKPLNEVISIEEQTEDGTKVQSEIRLPSQPSLPLQDLLFQACQLLNAVVPHTLPRKIHRDLVDTFVRSILEHYEEWSRSETIYQPQAWQMLLDVRTITLLLITQENKDLSESISEALEKIIDPFDLDVHYPYLQNCVKKSTQRLQATVGVLINFREKLPVFNGLKLTQNTSGTKVEEPNILAMSYNIPWFALLAVANQASEAPVSKESTPEKMVRTKEKESRKESKSRDFVKSANAFLNAMTSRWS